MQDLLVQFNIGKSRRKYSVLKEDFYLLNVSALGTVSVDPDLELRGGGGEFFTCFASFSFTQNAILLPKMRVG